MESNSHPLKNCSTAIGLCRVSSSVWSSDPLLRAVDATQSCFAKSRPKISSAESKLFLTWAAPGDTDILLKRLSKAIHRIQSKFQNLLRLLEFLRGSEKNRGSEVSGDETCVRKEGRFFVSHTERLAALCKYCQAMANGRKNAAENWQQTEDMHAHGVFEDR